MTQARPYAGVEASDRLATRRDRLLRAGLQLLGGTVDPPELTVRGICAEAGLATRYFYESFADKEEFIAAVFDWVVATLAGSTQAAVAAAPAMEQTRAGMSTIVLSIESDPRIGRLMFNSRLSNATVMRKRVESSALFAMLSGQHAETVLQRRASERIKAGAQFVVGGVAQTISAWLAGEVRLDADELVDQLTALIDGLTRPRLYE
ncbi:MAG: TetR/AcrR family transcriptional regulator [Actinomycetota bacterium]|nr:TetR/AcrR family transcriptional regulator [Actinomycetota bacterium]HPY25703.1 TetR/AcrR family transcriptional regulator [Mycobacterium sp.]